MLRMIRKTMALMFAVWLLAAPLAGAAHCLSQTSHACCGSEAPTIAPPQRACCQFRGTHPAPLVPLQCSGRERPLAQPSATVHPVVNSIVVPSVPVLFAVDHLRRSLDQLCILLI
jgi:hypothetical protein